VAGLFFVFQVYPIECFEEVKPSTKNVCQRANPEEVSSIRTPAQSAAATTKRIESETWSGSASRPDLRDLVWKVSLPANKKRNGAKKHQKYRRKSS
jgi:hypothetical protein